MSRLPKSYCALGIAAILVCSQFPRAQEVARVSTLNLQDYGWESPDPHRAPEIDRPAIAVDHNNRVVIGFTVRERGGLVTRNQPSLDFRIVRFSSDGKQDLSLSLPTHARGINGIYLTDTDKIVARVNDELRILEHEEDTLRKESWNILVSCPRDCQIRQSSTRHTVSLYNVDAVPPLTIIQASEPPIIRQCGKAPRQIESPDDTVQNYPQAITDKFAYFSGSFSMHEPFAYRWPLCDYDHRIEMEPPLKGGVTPLSDELFVTHRDNDLEVVSSDGRVKFRQPMAEHESWSGFWVPIRSSERGDRIAVDMLTTRGGNRTLDIAGHVTARRIAVYDIERGREVASIPVSAKHRYRYEFDLSPDGHRLAILEDDTVKVADLDQARTGEKFTERTDAMGLKDGTPHLQVPIPAGKPKQ